MKTCSKCKKHKAYTEFYKMTVSLDGHAYYCKECDNKRRREQRKADPVATQQSNRNRQLLKRYGMTIKDYEEMFEQQGCKCGICGVTENHSGNTGPRKEWSFSVDHCHTTGKVRGLLCNDCNRALGLFKDNTETIKAALMWLDTKDV